jgi:hypothetical protein
MKPAVHERLSDLIVVAQRLQAILDAEKPDNPLPTLPLCRTAIDVDDAVGKLERHADQLSGAIPF